VGRIDETGIWGIEISGKDKSKQGIFVMGDFEQWIEDYVT
jgi:hypothetical protein